MGREFTLRYTWPVVRKARPRRWIGKAANSFRVLTRDAVFFMGYLPNKGFWCGGYARLRLPTDMPWKPDTRRELPVMQKKKIAASGGSERHRAPVETEVFSGLMPLVEHIALTQYDDGDSREPGWITIKTQGRAWVVQVKDADAGVSFAVVGETLDRALETAALLLGCDEAPWEHDQWLTKKMPQKKKK